MFYKKEDFEQGIQDVKTLREEVDKAKVLGLTIEVKDIKREL